MKIQITQDDIDSGIKKSYTKCPIALALSRHFKEVRVENFEVTLDGKHYGMGTDLQLFAVNFDNNETVKPFEFEIAQPRQAMTPFSMNVVTR